MSELSSWAIKIELPTQSTRVIAQRSAAPSAARSVARAGDPCPWCRQGQLDYDGTLNLSCSQCGYIASSGVFS